MYPFLTAPRPVPDAFADTWVTRHALERVREHHPSCGWRGVLRLLAIAQRVAPGEVAGFLHRHPDAVRDEYFLAGDRRGIFVVADNGWRIHPRAVVTYIRFEPSQVERACLLWGPPA